MISTETVRKRSVQVLVDCCVFCVQWGIALPGMTTESTVIGFLIAFQRTGFYHLVGILTVFLLIYTNEYQLYFALERE